MKPHNQKEAENYINKAVEISKQELIDFITVESQKDKYQLETEMFGDSFVAYYPKMDLTKVYNSDVARELLKDLNIKETEEAISRAGLIVYNTRAYKKAEMTIQLYENYKKNGYIHFSEVTEQHHRKGAVMSGRKDIDFLSLETSEQKVKIIKTKDKTGYQKPRQRTRYYTVNPITDDLFVKLV